MYTEELEKLKIIAQKIQDFLEEDFEDTDANILVTRLTNINFYLATSGKALADAKEIQDKQAKIIFAEEIKSISKMPATIASKFITSQNADANYVVNWLDRLNRSLVHIGDNTRTQISFAKEELRLTKQGY